MPVESVQFVHEVWTPGGAAPTTYTVPGGFLAVVTDVQIISTASGRCIGRLVVTSDAAAVALVGYDTSDLAISQWHGRVAVPAAGHLYCSPSSANVLMEISVSGYLYS